MADPWFKFFQNDWLVTQGELSSDEQLVFLTVLVLIYDNDKPIVTDAEAVSRRCKLSVKRVEAALVRLFSIAKLKRNSEGRITNTFAEILINERQEAAKKRSEAGKARANRRWGKTLQHKAQGDAVCSSGASEDHAAVLQNQKEKENQKEKDKKNLYLEAAYTESVDWDEEGKSHLPADVTLTQDHITQALRLGLSLSETKEAFQHFVDFHKRDGIMRADWNAAWRYWCQRRKQLPQHQSRGDSRLA